MVAPAGPPDPVHLEEGLELLRATFEVVVQPNVYQRTGYFAGDNAARRESLQAALDDPSTRVIIAARGGFGTTKILDELDLAQFAERPKWIVGSSDLTALLVRVWDETQIATVHGPMVAGLPKSPADHAALEALLQTERPHWEASLASLRPGRAEGPLLGGNLTILAHLAGTLNPSLTDGSILFLEDVGERPYRLERALVQLERAGMLRNVRGLVLGEFTDCEPGRDGETPRDVLLRCLSPLGIPVADGYPAAHGLRNRPFIHGMPVTLDAGPDAATLRSIDS